MSSTGTTTPAEAEAGAAMGSAAPEVVSTVDLIGARDPIRFQRDTLRHRPLWIRQIIDGVDVRTPE